MSAALGPVIVSNVDSNITKGGPKVSHVKVKIYPTLSFLTHKKNPPICLYNKTHQHYDSSLSDLMMKFLRVRELGKVIITSFSQLLLWKL